MDTSCSSSLLRLLSFLFLGNVVGLAVRFGIPFSPCASFLGAVFAYSVILCVNFVDLPVFFAPFLVRYFCMQRDMSQGLLEDMFIRMEKNTSERMSARISERM